MTNECMKLIDQVVEDRQKLIKKMFWEADCSAMATISALLYASAGTKADVDKYTKCKKYFNRNVNIFSEMRGIAKVIVVTKMSLQDDYETYLAGVTEVYKKLRGIHKLTASPYMVMAAINIYEAGGLEKADENIEKLESVYKQLKSSHFFLTGDEDRPFLAMVVSRQMNLEEISNAVDECYNASKKLSFSKETMHTSAQIMALSGKSTEEKVEDLKDMLDALKQHKVKGLKYELMPLAAALGLVDGTADDKAAQIKEIYDCLATKKGFKWYLSSTKRSLYAGLIYSMVTINADNAIFSSVVSNTITNIIIEEIIVMIMVATAVNTASNSSSSGK